MPKMQEQFSAERASLCSRHTGAMLNDLHETPLHLP